MQRQNKLADFLPVCRPLISEQEIAAVAEVLRSGWITTGPKAAELEQRFAAHVGAAGAVALSSGTAGMHLVLEALGIGPGDEVITPSMTWVSTVNLITLRGATPVFADIDRNTLMVTPESIERVISERTRLIIPVHFAGAAAEIEGIGALAEARGIPMVEDAAHAIGTRYRGELIGSTGTTVFSFHPIKAITTGEGGMVCSQDTELLDRIRTLRFHGLGVDAWDRTTQGRKPQAEVLTPGYKYNLTDIGAALGIGQLERIEERNRQRQLLADTYLQKLAGLAEVQPLETSPWTTSHARSLFVVRLEIDRLAIDRDRFMERLKELNIGTGLHFRAVHLHSFYQQHQHLWRGELPETEWCSQRILSLPLFPGMDTAQVQSVVDGIKEVIESCYAHGSFPEQTAAPPRS